MGLLSSIQKIIAAPLAGAANLVTAGIEKITGKTYGRTTTEEALSIPYVKASTNIIAGLGAAAGAVAAAPSVAAAGGVGAVVQKAAVSLIPQSTVGKVALIAATPAVIGAIAEQPKEIAKAIANAPSELAQFGGDVAKLAANPSLQGVKELVSESPIITSAIALGATALGASKIIPAIATAKQTEAIKEQTEAYKDYTAGLEIASASGNYPTSGTGQIINTGSGVPITPATKTIQATAINGSKKRRKASRTSKTPVNNINIKIDDRDVYSVSPKRKIYKGGRR